MPGAATYHRLYDKRWARTSKAWLRSHPLCVWCLALGRPVSAACTDHIVPHKGIVSRFWDRDNWQSLCDTCHRAKSVLDAVDRVMDWQPRQGLVVVHGDVPYDVYLPSARLLRANELWINAMLLQRGRVVVSVGGGVRDAHEVAQRVRGQLVVVPAGD